MSDRPSIEIRPYLALPLTPSQSVQLDGIFFTSSQTQIFAGDADRAAFRERWLGRYLRVDADHAHVAIAADGTLVGYVVGSAGDPAKIARFADLASVRAFAGLSASYPAHLHINVAPAHRDRGLGAALIEAFGSCVARAGGAGMHVVTGSASRNVGFYNRSGFHEAGRFGAGEAQSVFLARAFPHRSRGLITI